MISPSALDPATDAGADNRLALTTECFEVLGLKSILKGATNSSDGLCLKLSNSDGARDLMELYRLSNHGAWTLSGKSSVAILAVSGWKYLSRDFSARYCSKDIAMVCRMSESIVRQKAPENKYDWGIEILRICWLNFVL
jgi:hypothetical protein